MLTWEYISSLFNFLHILKAFIDARTLQKIKVWDSEIVSPLAIGYDAD